MNRDFMLQSCSINLECAYQVIHFVGIARTTEMPHRRTVVEMWQNKGFLKLQQRLLINKFPKSKHYVKLIIYFLTDN